MGLGVTDLLSLSFFFDTGERRELLAGNGMSSSESESESAKTEGLGGTLEMSSWVGRVGTGFPVVRN